MTAYLRTNNMEEFIKNDEKMVELDPTAQDYFSLGQGYLKIKNYDKYRENLLKARKIAESTADTALLQLMDDVLKNTPQ